MTIDQFKQFRNLHKYDQNKVGFVGVERECFIMDAFRTGKIVAEARKVLSCIESRGIPHVRQVGNYWSGDHYETETTWHPVNPGEFGYELPACQIESRIGPCGLMDLKCELQRLDKLLDLLLNHNHFEPFHAEIGPEDIPLDVYPEERYKRITENMPREILLAASRVAGTHVHVGMRDHEMALRVYNYAIRHFAELCEIGDGSFGERLAIYKQMAPDYEPKPYASWEEYYQTALEKGFAEDPRKCWTLIRISVHGTIEFRMFGATDSIDRIVGWATRCHQICQEAMTSA